MSDITLCLDEDCPSKEKCYRFLGEKDPVHQSYIDFKKMREDRNECDYFWAV